MLWGDSHGKTFSAQAEACGRANHPGEKAALAATATHFERFRSPVQVGISRLSASDRSPRRTVLGRAASSGPGGVQLIRGMRCILLSISDP
jgi:hypothetical protein